MASQCLCFAPVPGNAFMSPSEVQLGFCLIHKTVQGDSGCRWLPLCPGFIQPSAAIAVLPGPLASTLEPVLTPSWCQAYSACTKHMPKKHVPHDGILFGESWSTVNRCTSARCPWQSEVSRVSSGSETLRLSIPEPPSLGQFI